MTYLIMMLLYLLQPSPIREPTIYCYKDAAGIERREFPPSSDVTIIGEGFGGKKGRVEYNYAPIKVVKWRTKTIIIRTPEDGNGRPGCIGIRTAKGRYVSSLSFAVTKKEN